MLFYILRKTTKKFNFELLHLFMSCMTFSFYCVLRRAEGPKEGSSIFDTYILIQSLLLIVLYNIYGIALQTQTYNDIKFTILDDLCADIILGQTFMEKHRVIMLSFGGYLRPLYICSLAVSNVTPPTLFTHLSKDCHPIAPKSHK